MNAISRVSVLGVVLVAGCGGKAVSLSGNELTDAGSAEEAAQDNEPTVFVLRMDDGLCLPQPLRLDARGQPPCRIVEVLATAGGESACVEFPGLTPPETHFEAQVRAAQNIYISHPVCQLAELPPDTWGGSSCATSSAAGWCYVVGPDSGTNCEQALRFSATAAPPAGAFALLACSAAF
jgi:hypothetical protein